MEPHLPEFSENAGFRCSLKRQRIYIALMNVSELSFSLLISQILAAVVYLNVILFAVSGCILILPNLQFLWYLRVAGRPMFESTECQSLIKLPVCLLLQVMILITGAHKAFALHKAIEEGVNHMWTVSAFQQHPRTLFVCDEDATLELKMKTVKYFQGG